MAWSFQLVDDRIDKSNNQDSPTHSFRFSSLYCTFLCIVSFLFVFCFCFILLFFVMFSLFQLTPFVKRIEEIPIIVQLQRSEEDGESTSTLKLSWPNVEQWAFMNEWHKIARISITSLCEKSHSVSYLPDFQNHHVIYSSISNCLTKLENN